MGSTAADRGDARAPGGSRRRSTAPPLDLPEHPPVDALVAIVPSRADFTRIQSEGWYRAPVASAPEALLAGRIRTLACYLPKVFGDDAWQVRWIASLCGVEVVSRRELLPQETAHPRARDLYLRLALGQLTALPRPILSLRLRRIAFIPTTRAKLETAAEINDLFHASPIEDALWRVFKREDIDAEREYFVSGDRGGRYALDFAIFGQERNLDVECDGDAYHANPARARYDNRRNNFLTTRGWLVLRFTTAQIREEMPEVVNQVWTAIKSCGGAVRETTPYAAPPPPHLLWQPALWDATLARGHCVDPRLPASQPKRRRR